MCGECIFCVKHLNLDPELHVNTNVTKRAQVSRHKVNTATLTGELKLELLIGY